MNEEIKARWVAALRNPEAKQIRGYLGNPDGGRCCLGVLCDLAVEDGVIEPPEEEAEYGELFYDGASSLPSDTVLRWAGFSPCSDDRFRYYGNVALLDREEARDGTRVCAQDANDGLQLTFDQIADLIEHRI
jgi:hypothetical protein